MKRNLQDWPSAAVLFKNKMCFLTFSAGFWHTVLYSPVLSPSLIYSNMVFFLTILITYFFPIHDILEFTKEKYPLSLRFGNRFHDPNLTRALLKLLDEDVVFWLQYLRLVTFCYTLNWITGIILTTGGLYPKFTATSLQIS